MTEVRDERAPGQIVALAMLLGEASEEELDTSLAGRSRRWMPHSPRSMTRPRRRAWARGDQAGLGSSAPRVARWLGDIRTYFPTSVVQVMQRDAIERLHLTSMLLEPELLDSIQPDVHLVSSLVSSAT